MVVSQEEVVAPVTTLKVGDKITAYSFLDASNPSWQGCGKNDWTVTEISLSGFGDVTRVMTRHGTFWNQNTGRLAVKVIRGHLQAQMASGAIQVGPKIIKEFPDHCTRCGRPAYVGAFEIAHQDEVAARDCPARRK